MSFLPELTVLWLLVAVPAAFGVAWARVKRRPLGPRTVQLLKLAGLGLVFYGLLAMSHVVGTRPNSMLKRFLEIEDTSEFKSVRSRYVGGLDYTAWLYFETSPERMRRLIDDGGFQRVPGKGDAYGRGWVQFAGAPPLPEPGATLTYDRISRRNRNSEWLMTDIAQERAWFVSLDH
jgi:hypothetical protein